MILCALFLFWSQAAISQTAPVKQFTGPYLGGAFGLTDDGEYYYAVEGGYRFQFNSGLVVGAEASYGDLTGPDSDDFVESIETISDVWSVVGLVGYSFGNQKRNLVFLNAGYGERTRSINDIDVTNDDEIVDIEGGGFFGGVGYERAIGSNVSVRLRATYFEPVRFRRFFDNGINRDKVYISTLGLLLRF